MDQLTKKLKEILTILIDSHNYQLGQNDQFAYRSYLIFVVVGLYFNVAFVIININDTVVLMLRIILLFLLGSAIFWALPIIRKPGYKTSPQFDSLISNFAKSNYNYNKLLAYLINNYQISIEHNRIKNSRRHHDIKLSIYFLAFSTLTIIILLGYSVLLKI